MPREGVGKELGAALRRLRLGAGMTQEELAHRAGIGVASLSRIETALANPTWTTVMRILEGLNLTLEDLSTALRK